MEQASCPAMDVKGDPQHSLEWQLNELQRELCSDGDELSSSVEAATTRLTADGVPMPTVEQDKGHGVAERHNHHHHHHHHHVHVGVGVGMANILDEALKEIAAESQPDVTESKPIQYVQSNEAPLASGVPCVQVSVHPSPPPAPPQPPAAPPHFATAGTATTTVVVSAAPTAAAVTVAPSGAAGAVAAMGTASKGPEGSFPPPPPPPPPPLSASLSAPGPPLPPPPTQIKIELPKAPLQPIKVETHNVLTVEVPKVVSVVPTAGVGGGGSVSVTSAGLTPVQSVPQTITLGSVAAAGGASVGGAYRLKTSGPLGNQVMGAPLMVTGVVIPRAPLSSNLISFVDASGNMQLAAVASPIINPTIQIRPGVMVNSGASLVVRPPASQLVSSGGGTLGTIVPLSSLSTVQPPVFKSTVRAILPNKTTVKTIYPIKGVVNSMNSELMKVPDVQQTVAARTTPTVREVPVEQEQLPPEFTSPQEPTANESKNLLQSKDGAASTAVLPPGPPPPPLPPPVPTTHTRDSPDLPEALASCKQEQQQQQQQQQVLPVQQLESSEATALTKTEDEDRVNDVKGKILSVSSSQGVSKAGELAKTNLFKLVKTESNVVITAPSTAVQDILEQLKKQFPDKKFVINYNSSKAASSNIKNLVTQATAAKKVMKATVKPAGERCPTTKRASDEKASAPSAKRKRVNNTVKKAGGNKKAPSSVQSASKGSPKRLKATAAAAAATAACTAGGAAAETTSSRPAVAYKSARLRGEKAPELFAGRKRKSAAAAAAAANAASVGAPVKQIQKNIGSTAPVRARGRPRKDRSTVVAQKTSISEQEIMNSIRDVEVKLDQLPEEVALQGSVRMGVGADELLGGATGEGHDSLGSSVTSSGSGGTSLSYNSEIRVGEEFQAEIPEFLGGILADDYPEHANIIYDPEKGLLDASRPEGSKSCENDYPLYDFVDWSPQDKKIFKRYLGTYKTKFGKYLAVLSHKRLLDIIDHYYSTHSPARDYVLPKKSKHYYLVSKTKQMIAPKGVFGILNEKRKVLPNRRFCANPNIFLYEDSLPTRRPKDVATGSKERAVALGGSSKAAKEVNGKSTKVVKFEDVMKPFSGKVGLQKPIVVVSMTAATTTTTTATAVTTVLTTTPLPANPSTASTADTPSTSCSSNSSSSSSSSTTIMVQPTTAEATAVGAITEITPAPSSVLSAPESSAAAQLCLPSTTLREASPASTNAYLFADSAVAASPATTASDSDSVVSPENDALTSCALRKVRPAGQDFEDDVKELVSKEALTELVGVEQSVQDLKDEIVSLKKAFQRNKAEIAQMDLEHKRIARTVEQVTKAIGKARKITEEWTKEDRMLTIQAFKSFGKDFKAVSNLVGTKSEQAVQQFYETNSQRYGLDQLTEASVAVPTADMPAAASTGSPSKSGAESPVRAPRPMPSILRRKISVKPLNV